MKDPDFRIVRSSWTTEVEAGMGKCEEKGEGSGGGVI
jgi:hypothetical protein